ncbi:MAG: Selenocysteine-specific translation elongation factor [uncultured Thermomicrobiales bacterium]|uniref:Selenocysteine-specific elongation factor n=1 Tax=uncultured Thermomicrobiales bacterium TaxID=1645740 RepID=A0A6J4U8D4_9BACT|nr:MAG: Selenocysteine-specific translation elongation factor [uncultured Thermomicrobiales bacterium]
MPPDPDGQTFVIGTAGHVDHGKSTLVRALTGIDPDRLAEEKARAMTIDLGFAWLRSPAGRDVSVVDVPGHERFIKNMLAGVGGIDAAMLVIAADEGPMPQTAEHLAILDLLEIGHGLAVLTKRDAVDADWLDLVTEETREWLRGSGLDGAPIVPVSATHGDGLSELLTTLDEVLATVPERATSGPPRLPIDRAFTIAGFGTVVTGTLSGGSLAVGQELRHLPSGRPVRVRGLQSHLSGLDRVGPGTRVAVNVTGLDVADVRRGDVLAPAGALRPAERLDIRVRLLADSPPLGQNDEVELFTGAAERLVRVTILDRETLAPGEEGWVQIRLSEPVAVARGDRLIIRRPSPSRTIGGGTVIDPAPARHRRFRPEVISALATLAEGTPEELVTQALAAPLDQKALATALPGLDRATLAEAISATVASGEVRVLGGTGTLVEGSGYLVSAEGWSRLRDRARAEVNAFHATHALRAGMPKEEFRRRLGITSPRLTDAVVVTAEADGDMRDLGALVAATGFTVTLGPDRRRAADAFLAMLRGAPMAPPPPASVGLDPDTLGAMVELGEVVRVAEEIVFDAETYGRIERGVIGLLDRDGAVTIASFRDHFDTSRKYAQAVLEYLDGQRVTRRVGDQRVRGPAASTIGRDDTEDQGR